MWKRDDVSKASTPLRGTCLPEGANYNELQCHVAPAKPAAARFVRRLVELIESGYGLTENQPAPTADNGSAAARPAPAEEQVANSESGPAGVVA